VGSNIPEARRILQAANAANPNPAIEQALALMTRESPFRRARSKMQPITPLHRERIEALAADENLPMAGIAVKADLPISAQGRVSEILNGLR